MLEFLRLPANDRPKIFGMTASPIYNSKNPILALETLERNMDAKVISVRENIIELSEHMSRPVEVSPYFTFALVRFRSSALL